MKGKTIKWTIIIVVVILLIANFTPVSYILHENYSYSNFDRSFIDSEEAGGTAAFKTVLLDYRDFLKKHPNKKATDSTLYRTFTIKPWRFWQWSDYLFCLERFRLPYKNNNN
jgi:hypothetical protein